MALFRPEVIDAQRRRLFGEVTLHQPVALAVFTGILVVATSIGIAFVGMATFVKKETVAGTIVPVAGLAEVVASRTGIVSDLTTDVGQLVRKGGTIAMVSADSASTRGDLSVLQTRETRARIAELDIQLATQATQAASERDRLVQRAFAAEVEAARLQTSSGYQRQQLALAEKQFSNIEPLVKQGYMSDLERDRRAQTVLLQRQAVEEASRLVEVRLSEASDLRAQAASFHARLATEQSQIRAAKSVLEQGLDEIDAQGRTPVRAPIDGRITAVHVHVGTPVGSGSQIVTIAPADSPLQAEVYIPTRAAGFVVEGQTVRMAVDAFPYQRFGMIDGIITRIHRSPVTAPQSTSELPQPAYRAWVRIAKPFIVAYGQRRSLQAGMAVSADIVTTRQTVLQTLLDPLMSVGRIR